MGVDLELRKSRLKGAGRRGGNRRLRAGHGGGVEGNISFSKEFPDEIFGGFGRKVGEFGVLRSVRCQFDERMPLGPGS